MTTDIKRKLVLPMPGRAARMMRSDRFRPVMVASSSPMPVGCPCICPCRGIQLVQAVEGLRQDFPHWLQPPHALPLADIENFLLRRVQQQVDSSAPSLASSRMLRAACIRVRTSYLSRTMLA